MERWLHRHGHTVLVIGTVLAIVALFIYATWFWEPVIYLGEWWDYTAFSDWPKEE